LILTPVERAPRADIGTDVGGLWLYEDCFCLNKRFSFEILDTALDCDFAAFDLD